MDGKRCKFADPVHNGYHCGSYAFNLLRDGIKQGDYCDVHYWRVRCEKAEAAALSQPAAAEGDSSHPAGGECGAVQLQLGPMALEFSSHQQWVNSARNWFINLAATNRNAAQKRYVTVDAAGRVCMIGADFARARDENTFPVRVYLIDATPKATP